MIEDQILKQASQLIEAGDQSCLLVESFTFKNDVYRVGDLVRVSLKNTVAKHSNFIAQLISGHLVKEFPIVGCSLPLVKIQYYFDKHSLSDTYKLLKKQLSENELFESDVQVFIPVNFLNGKMRVASLQEYFNNPDELNLKFTQAYYDTSKDKITPPLSSREKICYCQSIENPDYNYIMCEFCKKWFHYHCVGISVYNTDLSLNFFCKSCQQWFF